MSEAGPKVDVLTDASSVNGQHLPSGYKNVIVIGLTQSGKSSLIKAILDYANGSESASQVYVGDGNESATQQCSTYEVETPLNNHFLQPEDEELRNSGWTVVPSEDMEDEDLNVRQESEFTGATVKLRLIDTPGLSDSGNRKESHMANEQESEAIMIGEGMAVVDERHKLAIIAALAKVEDIHAVCFVISKSSNYGGSLRRIIREFISIFQLSFGSRSEMVNFHVIHTRIDLSDRYTNILEVRQRDFDEFSDIRAMHHFVENIPDLDDPISLYYANDALAGLLCALSQNDSVCVKGLKYPKADAHLINDQELKRTYGLIMDSLNERVLHIQQKERKKERKLKELCKVEEIMQRSVDELDTKLGQLDTDEEVEIGHKRMIVGKGQPNWVGWDEIFELKSIHPIVRVHREGTNGEWKEADTERERFRYKAIFHSGWFQEAPAAIRIYGYSKDKNAEEIKKLQSQREQKLKELRLGSSSGDSIRANLAQYQSNRAELEVLAGELQEERKLIDFGSDGDDSPSKCFDLSSKGLSIKNFTVDSPYAAAKGYGLWSKISKEYLPFNNADQQAIENELRSQLNDKICCIEAKENVNFLLLAQIEQMKTWTSHLEALQTAWKRLADAQKNQTKSLISSSDPATLYSDLRNIAHDAQTSILLDSPSDPLKGHIEEISTIIESALKMETECSKVQLARTEDKIEKIRGLSRSANYTLLQQQKEHNMLKLELDALEIVIEIVKDDCIQVGAAAMVLRGIAKGLKNPYLELINTVMLTLKLERM